MWLKDNKPNGFEVQDIRIGGVIQRIKSCGRRLRAYLDGETDAIEELDEEPLDFCTGGKPEGRGAELNDYLTTATSSVM